ncbi:MAG: transposase [Thermomicrobiales bacterium]
MCSHRRRLQKRLEDFDYSLPGPYWVTISLYNRIPRFGTVDGEGVHLSDAGQMIEDAWMNMPARFPTIELDTHIVMPDHLHALLTLHDGSKNLPELTLGRVIGAFKGFTTNQYSRGVRERGWIPYRQYFWIEDYYEHVIRDERDLVARRLYIDWNPWRWIAKRENDG